MNATTKHTLLFLLAVFISFAVKVLLAQQGHNPDVTSYEIVSDIVLNGGTVYSETDRYNYGPPWFLILGGIRWVHLHWFPSSGIQGFHTLVAAFLAGVDIALATMVWRSFGFRGALLFLLNPVSLLITGYHSQFDNLAVLVALAAVLVLQSAKSRRQLWLGYALLGGSLMVKHIFIFFPLWLYFNQLERGTDKRTALQAIVLPVLIFVLPFCPYLADARARSGIIRNVFFYVSDFGHSLSIYLIGVFIPVPPLLGAYATVFLGAATLFLWVIGIIFCGFIFRKKEPRELFLFYTIAMVTLAPSLADQYLAIPLIAVCVLLSWPLRIWYFAFVVLFLLLPGSYNWHPEFLSRLMPNGAIYRWHCLIPFVISLIAEVIRGYRRGEWSSEQWKQLGAFRFAGHC